MSRILVPSVLTVAILAASAAHADTSVLNINTAAALPVLVVTASKTPEAIEKVPARISVIDEQTIQQSAVTDLPHLLQREAALNIVQTGGYGQQTSIFTRGTNSNHTLVLKDGVRLNTGSTSAANINFFDLSNVSRIEVLKGPASVQYGSDAVGGVIQLISQAPKTQKFFTTVEGGELNTYKAIVGADLVQNDAYVQIRGQRQESDGSPVTNANTAKDASFDQKGYSLKVGIDNQQYALSAELQENKGSADYAATSTDLISQDFLNRFTNLKGRYNFSDTVEVNIRASRFEDQLTQNDLVDLYDYLPPNFTPVFKNSEIDYTNTERTEGDLNLKWNFAPNQNILTGINSTAADVDSLIYGTLYNKTLKSTGYYLQHQYQTEQLNTQAGLRVEDDKQYGSHTVGQLAARLQITPLTSIYANIGSAFRAPTGNQLYGFQGNPDLNPEESVSYELGLDHQLYRNLNLYTSVYQTKIDNLIAGIAGKLQNINKAKLTGAELGLKWQQNAWFATTEYAYVQPKNDKTDQDLVRRPRQTATLTTGWDNGVYGANVSLVAKSHSKDVADFPSTVLNITPGYVVANLNAFWRLNSNARVFANIQNIGNTHYKTSYYNSGIYYEALPRLATAGITLSY